MSVTRLGVPNANLISKGVVHGDYVYLAGIIPGDPVPPSVYEQTKDVLRRIDQTLVEAGSDKTKILRAEVFLSDMTSFKEMNRAWDEWKPKDQSPARATVETKLAHAELKVEIVITAAR